MYTWIPIRTNEDWQQVADKIPPEYSPKIVTEKIQAGVSADVKAVMIEFNYIDKDYRSTYYNYYSKKGRRYSSRCVRLHFFDESVEFDSENYRLTSPSDALSDNYFGYMVLRPTRISTIGRSVVSPDIRNGVRGFTITSEHKVHLLGYTLNVSGFPSMDQHTDISVCAHAACWSILRHYSERYEMHREYLVHDITLMAQHHDPGGLLPSKGLQISHAERIFHEAGTYPIYVARKMDGTAETDPQFYRQLTAYIESGIPLFAADHANRHAFAVIGCNRNSVIPEELGEQRYSWDELHSLIVVDDNYLPYTTISANNSVAGTPYAAENIDAFIVPLPEKVHYSADAVDRVVTVLRKLSDTIALPDPGSTIVRYFITTGSGYRRFVRDICSQYDPELVKIIMKLPFAQFLWVVEYATQEQWAAGQIAARAVIDATASIHEPMPLWLFHNQERAVFFNRRAGNMGAELPMKIELQDMAGAALSRMDQNLRSLKEK